MDDSWLVQVATETGYEKTWSFKSKDRAQQFISDRIDLVKHLGYDPDEVYYLIPIQ